MPRLGIFIVRRLLTTLALVYLIATFVFFLSRLSPYDPVLSALGNPENINAQSIAAERHQFGLDVPLWRQYVNYVTGLPRLNFGYSEARESLGQPVWSLLRAGVPVSLRLGLLALALALLIGLPIGLMSALKQNTPADYLSQTSVMLLHAVPLFVLAPLSQLVFGVYLGWLPVNGWGAPGIQGLKEMILPVALFGLALAGFYAKIFRACLLEVLSRDYIRTARAKGLRSDRILIVHAIKNTLLPMISVIGPSVAFLVVGSFIIESFFSIPGIGLVTVSAATESNYPVIEATTILVATTVMLVNMVTDIAYGIIDPRVRV
jgi:ABC-type dipeptide/oligopeptide/nickel transport system permease component